MLYGTFNLGISESQLNAATNTSVISATLIFLPDPRSSTTTASVDGSGYITIDGTRYDFQTAIKSSGSTVLATRSKTVTHNADGTKTVSVSGYLFGVGGTSRTFTCAKITRIFAVVLDPQDGTGVTTSVTKTYNVNLNLPTPTRFGYKFGGWCTGTNGTGTNYDTTYTANAATTLYAKWIENTAILSYNNNGHGVSITNMTMRYSAATYAAGALSASGYTFKKWKRSDNNEEILAGGLVKGANVNPADLTLTAIWETNKYKAHFDENGDDVSGNPPADVENIAYDTYYTFPTYDENDPDALKRDGYIFRGWSTSSTAVSADYSPGATVLWQFPSNTTFYAVWEGILKNIVYYSSATSNNFDDKNSYVEFDVDTVVEHHDYTVINVRVPDLVNYTFSGYWRLEDPKNLKDPNKDVHTEYGIVFPTCIIPYDYVVSESDNFLTVGSVIPYITKSINLYPVYRDNTPTLVSPLYSSYDYIPTGITEEVYFKYITREISNINLSVIDQNVITQTTFRTATNAPKVSLQFSYIHAKLVEVGNESHEISLNPIYSAQVYDASLNATYIYIIYKNTGSGADGVLTDPQSTNYKLVISGITDSFGKALADVTIYITPPKLVRDINKDGDAVAFFDTAPDYTETEKITTHTENELWNNGLLISKNYLINDDNFESALSNLMSISNIKTLDMIDLQKLLLWIVDRIN